jgi:hypothetical protein
MKKNDKRLFVLSICVLIGYLGQFSLTLANTGFRSGVDYDCFYSDNIFMNASQVSDFISQIQADFSFDKNRMNLYMATEVDILSANPEFNSFSLAAGIGYLLPLMGRNALYLDLSHSFLNYKDSYTDFNTNGPLFLVGSKWYISDQTLFKAGVSFQYKNYPNFESFDFSNYYLFLELHQFYNTQTKIQLHSKFNYRHYPHILPFYNFGENYNYYNNRGSFGKSKQNNSPGPVILKQQYSTMSIPSLSGIAAINQAFGTKLGITGEVEIRKNLKDFDYSRAEILIKNMYSIYHLNDDYLWEGVRFSIQFKTVLFDRLALSVEGRVSYFNKNYPGILILDEAGNPIEHALERGDSLLLYMLKISKEFGKLNIFAHFSIRNNHSNDDYFDYKMLTISAGIGYYF